MLAIILGAVALFSRPVEGAIPQTGKDKYHWGIIFILLPSTVALGLLGAKSSPMLFQVGALVICLIAAVIGGESFGHGRLVACLSLGALGLYSITGEITPLLATPLTVLAAIGAAALISWVFGARGCTALLVMLTASDVILWRLGILDAIVPYGAIGEIQLHLLGAVTLGDWTLGVGDFFAAALLATWLQRCSQPARLVAVAIQSLSFSGIAYLSAHGDVVMPATFACTLALGASVAVTHKKRRRTRRKMDIPGKAF